MPLEENKQMMGFVKSKKSKKKAVGENQEEKTDELMTSKGLLNS